MSKVIFNDDKVEILQSLMNNDNVSIGSIGLMIYFINNESMNIRIKNVADSVKECSSSISKYLSELKAAGYIDMRRNVVDDSKKIEFVYYIGNPTRYKVDINNKHLVNKNNCNHALKKCNKFSQVGVLSLQHLGAWYIIECFSYKKSKMSLDNITKTIKIQVNNFCKYIKSYNKVNELIEDEVVDTDKCYMRKF